MIGTTLCPIPFESMILLLHSYLFNHGLGAIGKEALGRLQSNSVLICGLKGLGLEIAKNIVLMGVKNLTIYDSDPVELRDLSSNVSSEVFT